MGEKTSADEELTFSHSSTSMNFLSTLIQWARIDARSRRFPSSEMITSPFAWRCVPLIVQSSTGELPVFFSRTTRCFPGNTLLARSIGGCEAWQGPYSSCAMSSPINHRLPSHRTERTRCLPRSRSSVYGRSMAIIERKGPDRSNRIGSRRTARAASEIANN